MKAPSWEPGPRDDTPAFTVLNYGGGRQTVAICVLIARGVLPRPDKIVMADTGRENPSTFEYLSRHVEPLLGNHGLRVEIASHSLAKVDMYANNGNLLVPAFTANGKLHAYCSNEWKRRVVDRYLRETQCPGKGVRWIGFSFEEKRRWRALHGISDGPWTTICPLVDLLVDSQTCVKIIESHGLPQPHRSSCFMCPNKRNNEWRDIRDNYPEEWAEAVRIDEEIRSNDEHGGVWLHHDRVPLANADLDKEEPREVTKNCTLGTCFI